MTSLPYTLPTLLPGDGDETYTITTGAGGGADGSLLGIPSLCSSAADLLIAQYRDKPLFRAWLCSYLDRLQDTDDAAVSFYQNALSLDNAEGVHLDLLGRIVGEAREGRTDAAYRRGLRVRVLISRSQGRPEDLLTIASRYEDDAAIVLREIQPARVTVEVAAPAVNPSEDVHLRLRKAKAAGVALQTITHPAPATAGRFFSLGHGAASVDPTNTTTGLGWTGDDRGGYLAHVLA